MQSRTMPRDCLCLWGEGGGGEKGGGRGEKGEEGGGRKGRRGERGGGSAPSTVGTLSNENGDGVR